MKKTIENVITLNNGKEMPALAFGTWKLLDEDAVPEMIRAAIKEGYRHFDMALVYENEKMIGEAFKDIFEEKIIKREELFITSKIWCTYYDHVDLAIDTTLRNLKMDYLDLYLVHWPVAMKPDAEFNSMWDKDDKAILNPLDLKKLWADMERLVRVGKTRSIGVSNFGIKNLTKLLALCEIKPACLQIEVHPFCQQRELLKFCHDNKITITCYSSLKCLKEIGGKVGKPVCDLSERLGYSRGNIIINYLISKGLGVVTKTSRMERLGENRTAVSMSEEDIKEIDGITVVKKYVNPKGFGEERFD